MDVISQFFHLPIVEASKALKIGTTSLKKICRKHGLARWPHRKVVLHCVHMMRPQLQLPATYPPHSKDKLWQCATQVKSEETKAAQAGEAGA